MDSPGEILSLCRLCLVKDQVNIPIFEEQGDIRQIFLKISSCLPVTITRHDQLPKKICDACSNKLDLLYEFWNSSASAEKTLLSWLGQAGVKDAGEKISAVAQQIAKPAETLVKEESEALDESQLINEANVINETNLTNESRDSFEEHSLDEDTKDEAEAPPPKRARRTAAVKAQINITPESDEDDDEDYDAGDAMTKMEDESDESESELKDDPSYSEVPGTSADDQAGPSGVGKDGVEAPQLIPDHPSEETPKIIEHLCNECGKKYLTKGAWATHMKRHDDRKKGIFYPCDVCGLKYVTKAGVEHHKKVVHLKDFQWCCDQCGRTFVSKRNLDGHMSITHQASNSKPFSCNFEQCSKSFSTSGSLRYHMLTHEGKTHSCNVCDASFHHPYRLRRHVKKYHENHSRPIFQCSFCDLKVSTKVSLTHHIRTHTGEKPFECHECGRNFISNNHLKTHRVVHTKEKPFSCKMCPKRYSQRGSVLLHVKRCHTEAVAKS